MDRRSLPPSRPRGTSPMRRTRVAVVPLVLATVAIAVAGGCGGTTVAERGSTATSSGPVATPPPATEAPTTTTTTAPPSPEELEVRAVLDRFWPPYLAAYANPAAVDPVLNELLVGEANLTILGRFEVLARSRQRTVPREPSQFTHHVMSVTFPEPDLASVRECLVDDLRLISDVREDSGLPEGMTVVIDDGVATSEITTTLRRDESGWRITVRDSTEWLDGVRDCDIFSP